MAMPDIRGVLPPMITPFTPAGELDIAAHVRNMKRWNGEELGGYVVLGSNSETPYLSETEKLALIETTAGHALAGRTVIAGTGLESTRGTILLTNLAAGLGAHAALVITPAFYGGRMNDEALKAHFLRVAEASRVPILLYNVPAYTHLSISPAVVEALSSHPNIIGMKDSSGDLPRLALLAGIVPRSFQLIAGTASVWYPALSLGVRAGILALANIAGAECARVRQLADEGRHEEARSLYLRLVPANLAVTSTFGVAGLKYAATLRGYDGGCVRSPLLPLTRREEEELRGILESCGLHRPA